MRNDHNYGEQPGGHREKSNLVKYALAAAVGAALGMFFAPKRGQETREDIKHHARGLANKFQRTGRDVSHKVQDIFGEVSDELEKSYSEMRENIQNTIADMKDGSEINRARYDEMVDNVVAQYSKGKRWTKEAMHNLRRSLRDEWEDMRRDDTKRP